MGIVGSSNISSVSGDIAITGTATDVTGTNQDGVWFDDGANLTTTGTAAVTINGTAANATSFGITVMNTTFTLTGASNSLIADAININTTNASINAGANTVLLRQKTNSTAINLGAADAAGTLGLSDAELDRITAGTLQIGDANSGTITVSAAITRPASTNVKLLSAGDVTFSGGGINTGGGTLLLDPGTSPAAVKPTFNGTDATASTVAFASDLAIVINGTTAGNGSGSTYTQLTVVGAVDLTGVDLILSGSHTPIAGQTFTIVDNDGTEAVTGIFNGLPQNAIIPNFLGSGLGAQISYTGGTGNDVVLTVVCVPVFTACPSAPVTANTAPGQCTAAVTYTVAASGTPAPALTYDFTAGVTTGSGNGTGSGATFNTGNTTVTVTATNTCGTATCSFTVQVNDTQNPSITCPAPVNTPTMFGQCSAIIAYSPPTYSDNCSATLVLLTPANPASGSTFPLGTTVVSWKAVDGAGNSAVCDFTVTVRDNQPPVFTTCPNPITRGTDAGQCYATVAYATPIATDNCGSATAMLQSPANTASGSQFPKGTTVVEWKATDTATPTANTATCSFTVTVNDTQQPTISCPMNQTIGTVTGQCHGTTTYTVGYSDNCSGGGAAIQSGIASGGNFPKGINTVTWRATDAAGLTRTCTFRVTVNDTEAPVITCPSVPPASTSSGTCTATVTYTTPTATDNCTGAITVVRISGPTSGGSFSLGPTTVIWRAIDGAGRSSTCSFSVTVTDATPPVISCPQSFPVTAPAGQCSTPAGYTTPTATDNCGVQSVFLLSGLPSGATFPMGATVNTWRALDNSGLSSTCSFTVTVSCGPSPNPIKALAGKKEQGAKSREQLDPETSVDALQALGFSLAPNPAQDEVRVSIENLGATGGELAVYDARGRLMWQQRVESSVVSRQSSAVSLADFPAGMYFVTLRAEGQTLTKRLVVQRL